jgi:hypothetical protein
VHLLRLLDRLPPRRRHVEAELGIEETDTEGTIIQKVEHAVLSAWGGSELRASLERAAPIRQIHDLSAPR